MENTQLLNSMCRAMLNLFLVVILISCSGCVSLIRIDGTYEGKVVDAATTQPIEGAVVHGTWVTVEVTPVSSMSTYYDSIELLTDRSGEFKIPGKGLLIFSNIDCLILTIFKAGYEQFPQIGRWNGLKEYGPFDKVTWESDKGTFRLKRLTLEERRKQGVIMPHVPKEKYRLMQTEVNKDNLEIGSPENTIIPVE